MTFKLTINGVDVCSNCMQRACTCPVTEVPPDDDTCAGGPVAAFTIDIPSTELVLAEQLAQALTSLSEMVGYIRRVGGFMYADDQRSLFHAQDVLRQHGIEVK
jgi:hypothetical protein